MIAAALRHYWYPVALSAEVSDRPFAARLLDEELVLYRAGERVAAAQDQCVHRGARLSDGWLDGKSLVCPYHGWAYGPDGACVRIPALPPGQSIPRRACLTRYQVEERYGLIWVCLDAPRADLPACPEYADPAYRVYLKSFTWQAEAGRITENFMDSSHFAWVHEGILGDRANPVDPPLDVVVDEVGLRYAIPNPLTGTERVYRVTLPYTLHLAREPRASEATGRRVLFFTCCPRSETETRHFCLVARDFDLDGDDAAFSALNDRVMAQDQAICERQRPPALPLDLADELHVRGPDTQSVAYRRALARLFGAMPSTRETEQMPAELSWAEPVKVRVERER